MVTVLIIDEIRQMITDLLLSQSGPGSLWKTAAERWRAGVSLVRSIRHAGRFIGMDAQAGEPERELLRLIGRIEAGSVVGCPLLLVPRLHNIHAENALSNQGMLIPANHQLEPI